MSIKVAVIQMAVAEGNLTANEKKAIAMVRQAAEAGAELVVLPELWNSGYQLEQLAQFAAPVLENTSLKKMKALAKEFGIYLVAGSVATRKEDCYYNTAITFDHNGDIIGKYNKIHLFPLGLREDQYFAGGDDFCLVESPWGKLGIVLCYDLRFPALCRNLALQGANILVVPAQFPKARIRHWQILNQARAIENQCFVVAANVTGKMDSPYCGSSMIISPWGEILAQGDEREQILYSELDLEEISKVRKTIPVFQQRKAILDEIDDTRW